MASDFCSRGDGRKAFRRGLCQSCYRSAPRVRAAAGEGDSADFRVSTQLKGLVAVAAALEGITPSEWWRQAAKQRLLRQSIGDAELQARLVEALGPSKPSEG